MRREGRMILPAIILVGFIYTLVWSLMTVAGRSDDQSEAIMQAWGARKNESFLSVVRK